MDTIKEKGVQILRKRDTKGFLAEEKLEQRGSERGREIEYVRRYIAFDCKHDKSEGKTLTSHLPL